jgi:hypothetical protein
MDGTPRRWHGRGAVFICPRCAARSDEGGPCAEDGVERLDGDADPLLGVKVGNYRLCAPIAGGIYRAVNGNTGGVAAIKVAGADATAELRAEARAVNLIQHAAVVRCDDQGALADGRAYLLMEALEGRTLAARLAEGPLGAREIASIRAAVRDAVAAAHAAGVTSGTLATETIVVGPGGVKLLGVGVGSAPLDLQALERVLAPSAFEAPAHTVALPTALMTVSVAPVLERRSHLRVVLLVVAVVVVSISAVAGWLLGSS